MLYHSFRAAKQQWNIIKYLGEHQKQNTSLLFVTGIICAAYHFSSTKYMCHINDVNNVQHHFVSFLSERMNFNCYVTPNIFFTYRFFHFQLRHLVNQQHDEKAKRRPIRSLRSVSHNSFGNALWDNKTY